MRLRQVRLKTKFWSLYPKVQSGLWHDAVALVRSVLYHHRGRPTFASLADRPLPAEHFDFRYGDPPRQDATSEPQSRCNDPRTEAPHGSSRVTGRSISIS